MNLKDDEMFAYAYYYDDLKSKGLNPDFEYKWKGEKRNPLYYKIESDVRNYLGFSRSNNDDSKDKPINDPMWNKTIPVIGTSYCHSRQFQVDDITHSVLNQICNRKRKGNSSTRNNVWLYQCESTKDWARFKDLHQVQSSKRIVW
jgi:hypothetical protein